MPSQRGSFDCLRLLAAGAVLCGHSYILSGAGKAGPFGVDAEWSSKIAVYVFFSMSGYLVAQSWERDPSIPRFMLKRSLRIFPALAFVIFGSALILGPLTTALDWRDYFSRSSTWTYLGKTLIYPAQHGLPGVFDDNPFPSVVNGSLWTLRIEFTLYVAVALLGYLGLLRRRGVAIATACACWAIATIVVCAPPDTLPLQHQAEFAFTTAAPFFFGAAMVGRKMSSVWSTAAAVAALGLAALYCRPAFVPILLIAVPVIALSVAHNATCDLRRYGDFSYGLYLWGFPIQQTIVHFWPQIGQPILLLGSLAIALPIAIVSWFAVERRALAAGPAFRRHKQDVQRESALTLS